MLLLASILFLLVAVAIILFLFGKSLMNYSSKNLSPNWIQLQKVSFMLNNWIIAWLFIIFKQIKTIQELSMKDKKGSKSKSSKMNTSKGVRKNNNSTGSAVHFENKWKRQKDEISTASSLIRNETKWDFLNLNIWHYSSWAFMRSIVKLQSRTMKIYRSAPNIFLPNKSDLCILYMIL